MLCFHYNQRMIWWISRQEKQLMLAIAQGETLKSHRDIDGNKVYTLWPLDQEAESQGVPYRVVQKLLARKLITTNQKFPAATFLLTTKGQEKVGRWQKQKTLRGIGAIVKFDS